MNPQPPDLESGALPLELLAFLKLQVPMPSAIDPEHGTRNLERVYFASLWGVCLRHQRQYFFNSTLSGVFCLFFVVE